MESLPIKIYINYCKCLFFNNTLIKCVDLKFLNNMKIIFTWWNKQTFGTFLKTLFTGRINLAINIIEIKETKDG